MDIPLINTAEEPQMLLWEKEEIAITQKETQEVNKSKSRIKPKIEMSLFDEVSDWRKQKLAETSTPLKLATVFSGIGAIEQALSRLSVKTEIIFACDNDKHVKESYFANYEIQENQWYNDVKQIEGEKYKGQIDLFVGGSPCQSFSMVGKRLGLDDTRGTLFYEFARLVNEIKPKVFIYENVKGLTNHDKGKTWEVIKDVFKDLGYTFYTQILNARNYGIPQNRERIFVIGFLDNVDFQFPMPIQLESTMQDFLEDNINSKYYLPPKGIDFVTKIENLKKQYTQINGMVALCQRANQQFNWHGDFVFNTRDIPEKYFLSDKVRNYVLATGTKNFYIKPEIDLGIVCEN